MTPALDAYTAARVRATLDRCAKDGSDPVLALHARRLLWSEPRERQIWAKAAEEIAAILDEATPAQLAKVAERRVPQSVGDMKAVVVAWMGTLRP